MACSKKKKKRHIERVIVTRLLPKEEVKGHFHWILWKSIFNLAVLSIFTNDL